MADGTTKRVEEIVKGDRVKTGQTSEERATVVRVLMRNSDDLHLVTYRVAGEFEEQSLPVTGDHLVWVDGRGWTLVQHLEGGEWLTTAEGKRATITKVKAVDGAQRVYTFVMREDHALYANGVLVQDGCGARLSGYGWSDGGWGP
jgi:hypothetical protein